MDSLQKKFIELSIKKNALKFGEFQLKSGRISPYFFNAGVFDDGECMDIIGSCYIQAIETIHQPIDCIFGPAYKGIPLAAVCARAMYARKKNVTFAYNRKEVKDHGEGGNIVGNLHGNVIIIDDVITAGTAIKEALQIIEKFRANTIGIITALDRMEKGQSTLSAVEELEQSCGVKVNSIINMQHIIKYLESENHPSLPSMLMYRDQYGI